ncbi:uncharacterized protein LOC117038420 [Rhinolophus ferrumequinum]|uniref:uncharacterized protein LOC117038420 n=1 Tax=Rhinolophus ferrumequinum TaxID=59479 RepID=UPI00140F5EFD|nr:uncharacterized protein LOC117038420 [Rhinolophus ferrumequinum]
MSKPQIQDSAPGPLRAASEHYSAVRPFGGSDITRFKVLKGSSVECKKQPPPSEKGCAFVLSQPCGSPPRLCVGPESHLCSCKRGWGRENRKQLLPPTSASRQLEVSFCLPPGTAAPGSQRSLPALLGSELPLSQADLVNPSMPGHLTRNWRAERKPGAPILARAPRLLCGGPERTKPQRSAAEPPSARLPVPGSQLPGLRGDAACSDCSPALRGLPCTF